MVKRRVGHQRACLRRRQGQSILEYVLIVAVVIIAIVAMQALVQGRISSLGNAAANQMNTAQQQLNNIVVKAQ